MSRIFLVHRKPSEGAERARALLRAGHEVHVHTPADPAALRRSPSDPVVRDVLSGYSGTPLPKKLGIKAGTTVAVLGAPADFDKTLGRLPVAVAEPGASALYLPATATRCPRVR